MPGVYDIAALDNVQDRLRVRRRITAPFFGFGTADNYYATQSSDQYLDQIRVPTLLIQAKDDPLIPFEIFDHPAIRENPNIKLVAVEHGGHLGFVSRRTPRFWVDRVVLRWLDEIRNKSSADDVSRIIHGVARPWRSASLRASKLRSFLTLLGIILATTTLIAVMSVIKGMNLYIANQVSDMGADGFRVRRIIMIGRFDAKKFMEMQKRNPEMTPRRVRVHQEQCASWSATSAWKPTAASRSSTGAVARLDPVHGRDVRTWASISNIQVGERPIHHRETTTIKRRSGRRSSATT